jgi:hypothetical protein
MLDGAVQGAERTELDRASQLTPGPDSELGVDVAQMPLDGPRTEEQPGTYLVVREPVTGQLGDVALLRGEIVAGLDDAPAALLASRDEFAVRARGERFHAHRREQLVREVEFGARVEPATFAPQPFAVQEMRASELRANASPAEMVDRRAEPAGRLSRRGRSDRRHPPLRRRLSGPQLLSRGSASGPSIALPL